VNVMQLTDMEHARLMEKNRPASPGGWLNNPGLGRERQRVARRSRAEASCWPAKIHAASPKIAELAVPVREDSGICLHDGQRYLSNPWRLNCISVQYPAAICAMGETSESPGNPLPISIPE